MFQLVLYFDTRFLYNVHIYYLENNKKLQSYLWFSTVVYIKHTLEYLLDLFRKVSNVILRVRY